MTEYFLKIWGGAMPYLEKELGINDMYHYFSTKEERDAFLEKIKPYNCYGLAMIKLEGEMSHLRTVVNVTLSFDESKYSFSYDCGYEYPEEAALFIFQDGNYSCDCNKSLFIREFCDKEFPKFPCGKKIKLEEINIKYKE